MSKAVVKRLESHFKDKILSMSDFRGDEEVTVAPKDWVAVAEFLKTDEKCSMDHFIDLTAVDYPEREVEGGARFDVLFMARSNANKSRIRVRTEVKDGQKAPTLCGVYAGANWAEREVYDMFGIVFDGHKDMRRILLYDEFEGFPLRKDYPIDRAQPLVEYRDVDTTLKMPPFGIEEGQPFARIDWEERLAGRDEQVSPSIGVQSGKRRTLSDSEIAEQQLPVVTEKVAAEPPPAAEEGS